MKTAHLEFMKSITKLRQEFGFTERQLCTPEETEKFTADLKAKKELPFDITYTSTGSSDGEGNMSTSYSFYRIVQTGITYQDKMEYLALLRAKDIKFIKSCVIFFVVLAVLFIVVYVVFGFPLYEFTSELEEYLPR